MTKYHQVLPCQVKCVYIVIVNGPMIWCGIVQTFFNLFIPAQEAGIYKNEIVPVEVKGKKGMNFRGR